MDPYAVAPYPKADFHTEPRAQDVVTAQMKAKSGRIARLGIIWAVVFFASLAFGILGLPSATLVGLGLLFVLFLPLAFLLLHASAPNCPQCGKRMKKDWAVLASGRSGEFAICPTCRIYLYTHRTLR